MFVRHENQSSEFGAKIGDRKWYKKRQEAQREYK